MLLSVKLEFYGICFVVLLIHIFLLHAAFYALCACDGMEKKDVKAYLRENGGIFRASTLLKEVESHNRQPAIYKELYSEFKKLMFALILTLLTAVVITVAKSQNVGIICSMLLLMLSLMLDSIAFFTIKTEKGVLSGEWVVQKSTLGEAESQAREESMRRRSVGIIVVMILITIGIPLLMFSSAKNGGKLPGWSTAARSIYQILATALYFFFLAVLNFTLYKKFFAALSHYAGVTKEEILEIKAQYVHMDSRAANRYMWDKVISFMRERAQDKREFGLMLHYTKATSFLSGFASFWMLAQIFLPIPALTLALGVAFPIATLVVAVLGFHKSKNFEAAKGCTSENFGGKKIVSSDMVGFLVSALLAVACVLTVVLGPRYAKPPTQPQNPNNEVQIVVPDAEQAVQTEPTSLSEEQAFLNSLPRPFYRMFTSYAFEMEDCAAEVKTAAGDYTVLSSAGGKLGTLEVQCCELRSHEAAKQVQENWKNMLMQRYGLEESAVSYKEEADFDLHAAIMEAEKGYVVVFSFQNTVTCASCDYEEKGKLEAVLTDLYYALED